MDASQIQRDFDPVTVDDYPLIQRYLSLAQYEESNHNLVNMILWIDSYPLFKCCLLYTSSFIFANSCCMQCRILSASWRTKSSLKSSSGTGVT